MLLCIKTTFKSSPDKVVEGAQQALAYRYVVAPNVNTHCHKPKELGEDVDKKNCRSTQLGACWVGRFSNLPRCNHCDVVWEAALSSQSVVAMSMCPSFQQLFPKSFKNQKNIIQHQLQTAANVRFRLARRFRQSSSP